MGLCEQSDHCHANLAHRCENVLNARLSCLRPTTSRVRMGAVAAVLTPVAAAALLTPVAAAALLTAVTAAALLTAAAALLAPGIA